MIYSSLSQAAYANTAADLISRLEGHINTVEDIGDGKATIGYGYTFERDNNVQLWQDAGIELTTEQWSVLSSIDDATTDAQKKQIALTQFDKILNLSEAKDLLAKTIPQYEGPANILGMPNSYEKAAFVSVIYNRGETAVYSKMTGFFDAINSGNRAEAWYEIRYNSQTTNPAYMQGIANRRYAESEMFSLHTDRGGIINATTEEAKQAAQMYTSHRLEILAYEQKYSPSSAASSTSTPGITNIYHELQPSITALKSIYGIGSSIALEEVQMVSGFIQNLDGDGTTYDGSYNDQDFLIGSNKNNMLFGGVGADVLVGLNGNDDLDGGQGNDILYGGLGHDWLKSSGGNDSMYGGDGFDIYEIKLSLGVNAAKTETLVRDTNGAGQIVLDNGTSQLSVVSGTATYDGSTDRWVLGGYSITKHGDDILIRIDDKNYITVKDFNNGDLGITLTTPTGQNPGDNNPGDGDPDGSDNGQPNPDPTRPRDDGSDEDEGNDNEGDNDYDPSTDPDVPPTDDGGQDNLGLNNDINDGHNLFQRTSTSEIIRDPIVIDLQKDGLNLHDLIDGANFDLTGDGTTDVVGWTRTEGFLAFDRNSNGNIDGIGELYGNATQTGFEMLRAEESYYATNGIGVADGIIDANDADLWSNLRIWQDANGNGVTDSGELLTMAQANIQSIDIRPQSVFEDGRWINNNQVLESGIVTFTDNSQTGAYEVLFQMLMADAVASPDNIYFGLDEELLALPQSRGYGAISSLQDAMAADVQLKGMVEDFVAAPISGSVNLNAQINAILFKWAGVENEAKPKFALLEKMFNEQLPDLPTPRVIDLIDQGYLNVYHVMASRLLAQGPMAELFPNIHYDALGDELILGDTFEDILSNLENSSLVGNIYALQALKMVLATNPEGLDATPEVINAAISDLIVEAVASPEDISFGLAGLVADLHVDTTIEAAIGNFYGAYRSEVEGTRFNDMIIGTDGNNYYGRGDYIITNAGDDYVLAGSGDDSIFGSAAYITNGGHDIVIGGDGNDSIGYDTGWNVDIKNNGNYLSGGEGADTIRAYGNENTIVGGEGNDWLYAGGYDNLINAGNGNDLLLGGSYGYIYNSAINMGAGDDSAGFQTLNNSILLLGDGNDEAGTSGSPSPIIRGSTVDGGAGNDMIGLSADTSNTILGGLGNDSIYATLTSTTDALNIDGGAGHDTITVRFNSGAAHGVVSVQDASGNDTYKLPISQPNTIYTLSDGDGIGTLMDGNIIIGGTIASTGSNSWQQGNYYFSMSSNDLVIKYSNSDTQKITISNFVNGSLGITLAPINLTLTGTSGKDTLVGSYGDDLLSGLENNDRLVGDVGNDTLDGGTGADTMIGGLGNDVYYVSTTTDLIQENVNEGTDTVYSAVTYTLGENIENLVLQGTSSLGGTGNGLNNSLTGNTASNVLNGMAGDDTMIGGLGNDSYYVDSEGDVVVEYANEGTDKVFSTITYTLGAGAENLTLIGSAIINGTGTNGNNTILGNIAANALYGLAGNDAINGGGGEDTLVGGLGNDTYTIDNLGVTVVEFEGEGTDRVISSIDYTLAANIENLTLTGLTDINGTGNELNNSLVGNDANNILTGLDGNDALNGDLGADTLIGGTGNDTYTVESTGDIVIEFANEGTDRVSSSISYVLGDNVENLTLTGTAATNGEGNSLNNSITGNSVDNILTGFEGNDSLNGGAGDDTMVGGIGDDIYTIDSLGDVVIENADEGMDRVTSAVDYTLGDHLENLTLSGIVATQGIGNGLNNTITGNSANNFLYGLAGNDTVSGSTGNDHIYGGTGIDRLTGGAGSDIFHFASADSGIGLYQRDIITDFTVGSDKIQLDDFAFGFSWLATGNFTAGGTGEGRYYDSGSSRILSFDRNGDGVADFEIQLSSKPAINSTDFI